MTSGSIAAAVTSIPAPDLLGSPESELLQAVAAEARSGLLASPRTLAPWLFYDELGSELFEQITELPEYYPTRTERAIFTAHAEEILAAASPSRPLALVELGSGTATKTGILLAAAVRRQGRVLYQPVDVSVTALLEAESTLARRVPGVTVVPQVANYTTERIAIQRPAGVSILALYIGSSIGNFSPTEARSVLQNLRSELAPGDSLLLGTDLAPGPNKSVATLLAAYDDAAGVTAAFNRNVLNRLNRVLGADFNPACFAHRSRWNVGYSRIEMHLESLTRQHLHIPANPGGAALDLTFEPGETIHTENSHKFTPESIAALLTSAGFGGTRSWTDSAGLFAVTLAAAV